MRPNMGWYDANPVHLAELTPSDYAQKLVEYFGDTDAVQKNAENVAALIEQEGDQGKRIKNNYYYNHHFSVIIKEKW